MNAAVIVLIALIAILFLFGPDCHTDHPAVTRGVLPPLEP